MQLILRDPSKPVTLQEKLASEALYEATEMESDKNELSWVEKYHKARNVAISVQQTLGEVCSTAERLKTLFLWVHPRKTLLVYIATVLAVLWFYFVPFRYMVICSIARLFTQRFHKVSNKDHVLFQNFLVSIPSDVDMKRIYARRNLEYLRQQEHAEAQTKLEAVWTGHVWRQATSGFRCWQECYCAVRGGHLEFWQSISDARAGLPPKVGFAVVNAIDKCTKAECSEAPRNSYPFAIFEVNPRLLRKGSRPKRRLLSLKTEEDFHALIAAIRSTGECLGS
ncbi:hypothetical protein Poli38472_009864 [Pythium oligandrum]|uniref:Multiple C2 domain-containing protein n=1 Tax=Pythium oligandrum TaxID=41045 RepID=A0A8K1FH60_PYTOL|nr:hypothetical protein Poli38472_009864 [Pythium oligandrum]|eukprot:TMW62371.1 hypothetical protein Poli38472_009864 [Pythium oligandrum]